MEKRKLLIADQSEEFCMALAGVLQKEYHIRLCKEGQETMKLLESFLPDILVLDMMLPGLDGISLLQRAAQRGINPMVLATTVYTNDYIEESLGLLGVGYFVVKPCDINGTADRIRDLSRRLNRPDPKVRIVKILNDMGFRSKYQGRICLCEAIALMCKDRRQAITKEIYPAVGRCLGISGKQVERSIRSAAEIAWVARDEQIWKKYLPAGEALREKKPTNGELICALADYILLNPEEY